MAGMVSTPDARQQHLRKRVRRGADAYSQYVSEQPGRSVTIAAAAAPLSRPC